MHWRGSPGSSAVRNPPANAGDARDGGRSLGLEDPPEKEMATHSSIRAWRISWTEEPGRLQPMGLQRSRKRLSDWACCSVFEMHPCSRMDQSFTFLAACSFSFNWAHRCAPPVSPIMGLCSPGTKILLDIVAGARIPLIQAWTHSLGYLQWLLPRNPVLALTCTRGDMSSISWSDHSWQPVMVIQVWLGMSKTFWMRVFQGRLIFSGGLTLCVAFPFRITC